MSHNNAPVFLFKIEREDKSTDVSKVLIDFSKFLADDFSYCLSCFWLIKDQVLRIKEQVRSWLFLAEFDNSIDDLIV